MTTTTTTGLVILHSHHTDFFYMHTIFCFLPSFHLFNQILKKINIVIFEHIQMFEIIKWYVSLSDDKFEIFFCARISTPA